MQNEEKNEPNPSIQRDFERRLKYILPAYQSYIKCKKKRYPHTHTHFKGEENTETKIVRTEEKKHT